MPNRILRAELLDSEAWLALKDNADRAAYIACLLTVDTLGTMPAGPHRLVKLWRPYGIDTPEKAAKVVSDLADVDLVRRFESDKKQYLHIPRFRQSRRFLGHVWPISPWATNEEKQAVAKKSQVIHTSPPVILREPPIGVGVGVGVGVSTKTKPTPPASLPAGLLVSEELWLAFREVRKKLRAAQTTTAEQLLAKTLVRLAKLGNDPTRVVEQSIERSWKGLFPVGTEAPSKSFAKVY